MDLFMPLMKAMYGAVSQGVLWGVMTLGVYITFKILDYADLTVDGSFATGGAVSALFIMKLNFDPFLSLLFAMLAGMLAGLVTGLLHTKFKIPGILSGILCMIALYSVNIRIMGKPNTPFLGGNTVITQVKKLPFFGDATDYSVTLLLGLLVSAVLIALLYWFFGTELGCCIRATGNNEFMVRALGGSTDMMKIIGLMLSNGLVALSGALVAQSQGYADVGMGTGTIVIGLASVIIGEVIFGKRFSFAYRLMSVVVGSVLYRIIIAIVLQTGFVKTDDLKLFTAIVVTLALAVPALNKKKAVRRQPAAKTEQGVG